jgi:flagellar basal body P-ring formation protein FlgA
MTRQQSILLIAMTAVWAAAVPAAPARAGEGEKVRIYVPRAIAVSAPDLRLDAVCVVQCQDEALAQSASAVALGRSPMKDERITIDRKTLLSRLAACGIAAARVEFTGTEQVSVTRNEKTVEARQLVQAAEDYLQRTHPGAQGAMYQLVEAPRPISMMDTRKDVEFRPRLVQGAAPGSVKVEVAVLTDGNQESGSREIAFKLAYPRKELVATKDIPADGMVTPENAKVQIVPGDQPSAEGPAVPFGATLAVAASQGSTIAPAMLKQARGPAGAPLAVRRNQSVVMKIQTPQFTISSVGVALQDGRAGDVIKVQNLDSRRIVTAKIAPDGTVSPVYEEKS